jgi:hypothetical protein
MSLINYLPTSRFCLPITLLILVTGCLGNGRTFKGKLLRIWKMGQLTAIIITGRTKGSLDILLTGTVRSRLSTSELYSPGTDHKENTVSDYSTVVWRHYRNGPQRKQQFLPQLRCLATVVNKRFHCWLLTYSVHVTISYLLLDFSPLRNLASILLYCLPFASISLHSALVNHSLHLQATSIWASRLFFYFPLTSKIAFIHPCWIHSNHTPLPTPLVFSVQFPLPNQRVLYNSLSLLSILLSHLFNINLCLLAHFPYFEKIE